MHLRNITVSNFQSFGSIPVTVELPKLTFLIGPNGSGKTALLQALCRLFSTDGNLRRIQRSDFHIPITQTESAVASQLFVEATFEFPELDNDDENHMAIPPFFAHMRLESIEEAAQVVFRLEATLHPNGEIDECLYYVVQRSEDGSVLTKHPVPRADRRHIQLHYIPARRNPSEHIAYSARSLLGRVLRAVNWNEQHEAVATIASQLNGGLANNPGVAQLASKIAESWRALHQGDFFRDLHVKFAGGDIESLLQNVSLAFSPAHGQDEVVFSRLSDGEQSLLYLSIVVAIHDIGREALTSEEQLFDPIKLGPAVFTIVGLEEPENSLSPHYLGRIAHLLTRVAGDNQSQSVIATHSPALLKRVHPDNIRYLRLNAQRETTAQRIRLPPAADTAYRFVREAVQAFPELYFSRLVVLGEGDSEEILLPRLLGAKGLTTDLAAISIVPLGGRHVHHFWRLLTDLGIPYVTLLDLDWGRHEGGWGRIKYVANKFLEIGGRDNEITAAAIAALPRWNNLDSGPANGLMESWLSRLRRAGIFFAAPLDLDFAMLQAFPEAFGVESSQPHPTPSLIKSVLGESGTDGQQYTEAERALFSRYHHLFKLRSKPAAHLAALSQLGDDQLAAGIPDFLQALVAQVDARLSELPA